MIPFISRGSYLLLERGRLLGTKHLFLPCGCLLKGGRYHGLLGVINIESLTGKGLMVSQAMFRLGARARFSGTGNRHSLFVGSTSTYLRGSTWKPFPGTGTCLNKLSLVPALFLPDLPAIQSAK